MDKKITNKQFLYLCEEKWLKIMTPKYERVAIECLYYLIKTDKYDSDLDILNCLVNKYVSIVNMGENAHMHKGYDGKYDVMITTKSMPLKMLTVLSYLKMGNLDEYQEDNCWEYLKNEAWPTVEK